MDGKSIFLIMLLGALDGNSSDPVGGKVAAAKDDCKSSAVCYKGGNEVEQSPVKKHNLKDTGNVG
jgi:hypothetical protein